MWVRAALVTNVLQMKSLPDGSVNQIYELRFMGICKPAGLLHARFLVYSLAQLPRDLTVVETCVISVSLKCAVCIVITDSETAFYYSP